MNRITTKTTINLLSLLVGGCIAVGFFLHRISFTEASAAAGSLFGFLVLMLFVFSLVEE